MTRINVAFAKIGKSVKFRRHSWNSNGGDNEPLALLQSLANNNPSVTYYIVGRSDWSKLSHDERLALFPLDNVRDIWSSPEAEELFQAARDNCTRRVKTGGDVRNSAIYPEDVDPRYDTFVIDYLARHGIVIDHAVFLVGQMCIANLRGITRLKNDPSKFCQPLMMGVLFGLPILRWINETRPRYVEIITDQLYDLSQPRDLTHFPTHSLGQIDCEYETLHMLSYEDQTHVLRKIPSTYAPVETLFCVGRKMQPFDNDRDIDFAVVCNERRPSRYPMLKKWVLDEFPSVSVYGRWAEGRGSKTLDAQSEKIAGDARFKGSLHLDALHETMRRVKTTFVVPQHRGGVTSKWCEMLHSGVVPFFHPDYDTQKKVHVPEFLRPRTPRELRERVAAVVSSDDHRLALITKLRADLLHDGFYDGSVVSSTIMDLVYQDLGSTRPNARVSRDWAVPATSTLEELFA